MVSLKHHNIPLFLIILSPFLATSSAVAGGYPSPVIKAAYYPSWTKNLPPSSINTSLFTHIFYAFLTPSKVTHKFEVSNSTATSLRSFTTAMRHVDPPAKTLFSVGGSGSGKGFSLMASKPSSRRAFIDSCLEVAREFGFDGVDLDWEFPESPFEMGLLGLLVREFRSRVKNEARFTSGPRLLITAAVYYSVGPFLSGRKRVYPAQSMAKSLDWVNVMSYDYNGAWSNLTGPNSALFDPRSKVNTVNGIKSWIRAGMPSEKMVMGLPLYGRTWRLQDPSGINGFGSIAVGPGLGDGASSFAEVDRRVEESGATVVYDVDTISLYATVGSSWISFDNAFTITTKIGFAQALGLRGYFFWALSYDKGWEISTQASRSWIVDT